MTEDLVQLADLLRARNAIDRGIARILRRPAHPGHIAEFIAARIFEITLDQAANHKGTDGRFASGPLVGRSVNVKYRFGNDGTLDMNPAAHPDYDLLLGGPRGGAISSRNQVSQFTIKGVFVFESRSLLQALAARGVKIGAATSVVRALWDAAEIYPASRSPILPLSDEQRTALALFA